MTRVPGQFVAVEVVCVTGPSVTVSPDPMGTGAPCVAVVVGAGLDETVVSAVGDVLAVGDLVGDGVAEAFAGVLPVGFEVGFEVGCPVPAEVPAAAEAIALATAEPAGAEPATPVDDTAALGSVLDAAAAAAPDDAALLLCDELEHPESASAATTVAPTKPVTRARTVMVFPPEGMRQQ